MSDFYREKFAMHMQQDIYPQLQHLMVSCQYKKEKYVIFLSMHAGKYATFYLVSM